MWASYWWPWLWSSSVQHGGRHEDATIVPIARRRSPSRNVHLRGMTVSMRVMSAGDGYKYLLRSVAAADGDRSLATPLTRYYVEEGTP